MLEIARPGTRRHRSWQAAAAALLAAGLGGTALASVAVYIARHDQDAPESRSTRAARPKPSRPAEPAVPPEETTAPEAPPVEPTAPDATSRAETTPDRKDAPDRRPAPRPASPAIEPGTEPTRAPRWLEAANRLRAERRWQRAERAYLRVVRAAPGSDEAYAAAVAAASLRLEQLDRPGDARMLYTRVLSQRPRGPLAEEARLGLAQAARKLGDRSAERQALEAFLTHHPRSLQQAEVEARLRQLSP